MGKPYSVDLRRCVVAAIEAGMSRNQAAGQFGVTISTAIGWMQRVGQTGSVAPGQMGGHKPKAISGEHAIWLSQRTGVGDFTLRGLVAELGERGLKVDYRSLWEFVHAEKLSFKKSVVAGERDRPDVARRRAQWTKYQDRVAGTRQRPTETALFATSGSDEAPALPDLRSCRHRTATISNFAWAAGPFQLRSRGHSGSRSAG